jgi:hypothetical protein
MGVVVGGGGVFWAATNDDVLRATAAATPQPEAPKAFEAALATLAVPVQSMQYVRTWVGTERGENGKTRVTLVWEPTSAPAGTRREEAGRVSVIAASDAGDLIYRGRVPQSLPPPAQAATANVGPQRVTFDAAPGPIELRLSVEATTGGVIDNEVRKLMVPDLTAPQAALSTPRLFRARTARDLQAILHDADAVPVTAREFSRTERVLIRFDAYAAGSEMPKVSAALLNQSGQKMADLPVAAATAGGTHQIDLGLASVPPAEYLVEITVAGAGGDAKEYVALRVVS